MVYKAWVASWALIALTFLSSLNNDNLVVFFFLMKNVNKHMTIKVCIKVDLI